MGRIDAVVGRMTDNRSNAFVGATNNLLQQAKRAAWGFRTGSTFIAIAYLRMSKLKHLPCHPFTSANANRECCVPHETTKRPCKTPPVPHCRCYGWLERPAYEQAQANALLLQQIRQTHAASDATYGVPRIQAELADQGIKARFAVSLRLCAPTVFAASAGAGAGA